MGKQTVATLHRLNWLQKLPGERNRQNPPLSATRWPSPARTDYVDVGRPQGWDDDKASASRVAIEVLYTDDANLKVSVLHSIVTLFLTA